MAQALAGVDHEERDAARAALVRGGSALEVARVVEALSAPLDATRRRAARLLSELPPQRALPPLRALVARGGEGAPPHRDALCLAARLISALSETAEPALALLLAHTDPKVRRAALTPACPLEAAAGALADVDEGVSAQAAALWARAPAPPPTEALAAALAARPGSPALVRLLAASSPLDPLVSEAARRGEEVGLSYLSSLSVVDELLADQALAEAPLSLTAAAWALARLNTPEGRERLVGLATHPLPAARAAAARALPPEHPALAPLAADPDAGVAWIARRALAGAFEPALLAARVGPHARLSSPSARPPYGLRPYDELPRVPRVRAALALCHTRFDVNLGVALRSAEAAGLEALYLVGDRATSLSSARGAELAIPLHVVPDAAALLLRARAAGYQVVAVQQTPQSEPYHLASYPPRPLFVLGAEDTGLPDALRAAADLAVEIPLYGLIDSLNVASAATCVVMHWRAHASPEPSL